MNSEKKKKLILSLIINVLENECKKNEDINDILSEMSSIEGLLNSLEYVSLEDELTTTIEKDHGEDVVVLGGGDVLTINAEQHAELKKLVSELRNSIIEGSL